jgi:hypothetical protein
MRSITNLALTLFTLLTLCGCSRQREPASPLIKIRILDEDHLPLKGIPVTRRWYGGDQDQSGTDEMQTDAAGLCTFPEVARQGGVSFGVTKRVISRFGPCVVGAEGSTVVLIRYSGRYEVIPKDKSLHSFGASQQDSDGVFFLATTNARSDSLVYLTVPRTNRVFEYTLVSKRYEQQ